MCFNNDDDHNDRNGHGCHGGRDDRDDAQYVSRLGRALVCTLGL